MALETGDYIDSLEPANPTIADPIRYGDDHLRLIKQTVKNTFPDITGPVTADQDELNLLDGCTASTLELNFLEGVMSPIQDQISDTASRGVPAGFVGMFAASAPPTGWLACNGAAISRTDYAELFAAIQTIHGAGDGSTTFNLPDYRGEFVRGWDDGRGLDAGRGFGDVQGDAIRNIYGDINFHGAGAATVLSVNFGGAFQGTTYRGSYRPGGSNTAGAGSYDGARFDASLLVPTANENRPRNVSLLYMIKY